MTYPWLRKSSGPATRFAGKLGMRSKTMCLVLSAVIASLGLVTMAEAVQEPAGCSQNAVVFELAKDKSSVANGETVTYTISIGNGNDPACTASNLAVGALCPNASGVPTVAPPGGINVINPIPNPLGVPTATFTYGTFDCVINVNAGVTIAQAQSTLSGILNDLPGANDPLSRLNTVSVNIVEPDMTVAKTCRFVDETVIISGTVTNTGNEDLINLECVDDQGCSVDLSGTSIPVGGQVTFSGSCQDNSSPHRDIVTCVAVGEGSEMTIERASLPTFCVIPPPPVEQIPTLSGWVMILLGVFLAMVGAVTMLRRRPIA